jgi:hypothetical protein
MILAEHNLLLRTRRGKTHIVGEHHLNQRHASLWDRLRYRSRFIEMQQLPPTATL